MPETYQVVDVGMAGAAGCELCQGRLDPGGHDWTLFCTGCERFFNYSGCSCDGCCGDGAYGMYGGGRSYSIAPLRAPGEGEAGRYVARLIEAQRQIDEKELDRNAVRWHDWAAEAARFGAAALAPLLAILSAGSMREQALAARALGRLADPAALDALVGALAHQSALVRAEAAGALGYLKHEGALGSLIAALSDPDWQVRKATAEALGRLDDQRAIPYLRAALPDREQIWSIEEAIRQALRLLDGATQQ